MSKAKVVGLSVVAVIVLLSWGITRTGAQQEAAKGKTAESPKGYYEKLKAIWKEFDDEGKRLGLDRAGLKAKYPTPEIRLCPLLRTVPGGTSDVVVEGKFAPGTKFLFETYNNVDTENEQVSTSGYNAKIHVDSEAWPGAARLHAITATSNKECMPLYIGGKYQWELTAKNGWIIKIRTMDERFIPPKGKNRMRMMPQPICQVEFYRQGETAPFEVREIELSLDNGTSQGGYSGSLKDPKAGKESAAEQERKRQEFGCNSLNFRRAGSGVQGGMSCGPKINWLDITGGTMKFLGD